MIRPLSLVVALLTASTAWAQTPTKPAADAARTKPGTG